MKEIKTVFVDWNGTLSVSKFWEHLEDEEYQKIQESLFVNLAQLINPWMRGEYTSEDILSKVAVDSGLNYTTLFKEFVVSCQGMEYVSDEVLPLVQAIRELGTGVVIATDNMDSFSRFTAPSLGLANLFDGILNSYDMRARKGDFDEKGRSLFFGDFLVRKGIKPEETILIDDSNDEESRIAKLGIEYRKIEPGRGLVPELKKILTELG